MFTANMNIKDYDPVLWQAIQDENRRQEEHIELIASENYASPRVMEAQGSQFTNKYAEGYPGKRYYGGCEYADIVEQLAIDRAKELFGADYVNVQPHSGSQANAAVVVKYGDTVVLKPSSTTTLSLLVLMELIQDVIPKGVVNLITGKGSTSGEFLKNHPDLDKLAFTGSTAVGRDIALAAAEKLIPATLELGGKSANIILDDADIEKALEGAQLGILFNQGQVCCAGSRIFVQEGIYDEFVEKLVKKFENIKIGNPLDPTTVMGSQIDARQVKTILDYVEIAKQEGGVVLTGGVKYTENGCDKGNFVRPTLITNVNNGCRISQEEVFGPVAVIIKFKTDDEVIAQANDSEYGLGGAVFTKNINRALRLAREIQTGRVWVNTYNQIPEHAPFGGYKKSGIGRETHKVILEHYTQMKNILIDLEEGTSGLY